MRDATTTPSLIDDLLSDAIMRGAAVGLAASAVLPDGSLYEGAAGRRDDSGSPMSPDTILWLASLTKAVTALAAMQLVELGLVSLDEPIGRVIPAIDDLRVIDPAAFGLRPAAARITLRHLLTHTSGLSYTLFDEQTERYNEMEQIPSIVTCSVDALAQPLRHDPGTRWEYGIGLDWVGVVVEVLSGMKLGDYCRARIFEPLGMSDTSFVLCERLRARRASIYLRRPDDSLEVDPFQLPEVPAMHCGGLGLYGSVRDYICFLRAMLNGGAIGDVRVASRETVRLMSENAIGELAVGSLRSNVPQYSNNWTPGAGSVHGYGPKWGLSFLIEQSDVPAGRRAGSLSWAGLANCYYWIDPAAGVCGLLAAQILPFADPAMLDLYAEFERLVYRKVESDSDIRTFEHVV